MKQITTLSPAKYGPVAVPPIIGEISCGTVLVSRLTPSGVCLIYEVDEIGGNPFVAVYGVYQRVPAIRGSIGMLKSKDGFLELLPYKGKGDILKAETRYPTMRELSTFLMSSGV